MAMSVGVVHDKDLLFASTPPREKEHLGFRTTVPTLWVVYLATEVCPDSLDMQCTILYTHARPRISLSLQLITPHGTFK